MTNIKEEISTLSSYEGIVGSWGYEVVDQQGFGDYQGDIAFMLRDGERVGYIVIGYGSCSGCDHLQSILDNLFYKTEEEQLEGLRTYRDQLKDDISWFDSWDALHAEVTGSSFNGNDWYWFDEDLMHYIKSVSAELARQAKA